MIWVYIILGFVAVFVLLCAGYFLYEFIRIGLLLVTDRAKFNEIMAEYKALAEIRRAEKLKKQKVKKLAKQKIKQAKKSTFPYRPPTLLPLRTALGLPPL